jgi:hypothetical protein
MRLPPVHADSHWQSKIWIETHRGGLDGASLQAGRFNGFVQVLSMRSALLSIVRAAVAGRTGQNSEARFGARRNVEDGVRDMIGYLACNDLRRGGRVRSPTSSK